MMKKLRKILVPIANGTEELEAISIIDTLRRATADVTVVKVPENKDDENHLQIIASRNAKLVADKFLNDILNEDFDCIALPGGANGAKNFANNKSLISILQKQKKSGKLYSAICASPAIVFTPNDLFEGIKYATCYPSFHKDLPDFIDKESMKQKVVVDQNCITSQGPCTAVEFALVIIENLYDKETSQNVGKGMLFY